MTRATKLTITENHLKLLNRMNVDWCGDEFGAPSIDPKRPYGNSFVYGDIAEAVGLAPEAGGEFSEAQRQGMDTLHQEMRDVLQVLVSNACTGLKPGDMFEREAAWRPWKREG